MSAAPGWLTAIFPTPDSYLYYSGTINGKPFARHWMVPVERVSHEDEGHPFECYVELDPKALGAGGAIIQQRTRLLLHDDYRPWRYLSEAAGARVMLSVDDETFHAQLPDGQSVEIPRAGGEWIVEANLTGLDALLFARLRSEGRIVDGELIKLFFVNQFLVIPYTLSNVATAADGSVSFRSSHDEDITLDADGVLRRSGMAKQGIVFELERENAPALPDWRGSLNATAPKKRAVYTPPAERSFELEDVQIPATGSPVGGSMSVPRGDGPFPAVLFLSGTGKHDRHGIAGEVDLGTHEVMDFLAENGIAGLRYDTRGAGGTDLGASPLSQALGPLVDDARSALVFLRSRDDVDSSRVTLLGHSQGGLIALILAADDHSIQAVALMATIGRSLEDLLSDQISKQGAAMAMSPDQTAQQKSDLREFAEMVRSGTEFKPENVPDRLMPYARMADWVGEHQNNNPQELIAKLTCPVLIAQGEKDFQVLESDARALVAGAKAGGVEYTLMILPGLDHLFKPIDGESTLESYFTERHVDVQFLEQLRGWLQKVTP